MTIRKFPPEEITKMAKSKRWGDELPTRPFPSYPCPDCGRMARPSRAWVNQKGDWVCNLVCEECPESTARCGIVCDYSWAVWRTSPLFDSNPFYIKAFSAKVMTLDAYL